MADKNTIGVYDEQAAEYADLVQREIADPSLESFVARLAPGDYVLDLGCGPAHYSAQMQEQGLRVDPVDASEQMVKLANETFDIGARQALFDEIEGENIYHAVWANFSLLHATTAEFPRILAQIQRALKPDGLLHLAMKLGTGSKRDRLDRFYSYYSETQLREYLSDAGFAINSVRQGADKGLAGDVEPWIAVLSTAKLK